MTLEYKQSLSEVSTILAHMEKRYVEVIPEKILVFINDNKDKNYIVKIDSSKPINEQVLKEDTKALLSLFYEKYWCTKENLNLNKERKRMVKTKFDRKALKEVYEVLMLLNKEELEKIPKGLVKAIENNCDMNYEVDINNIEENMLPDTQNILATIYTNYLATKEEKEVIHKIALLEKENKRIPKAATNSKIEIKSVEEVTNENKEVEEKMMVVKKENFISKIFNKIKKLLGVNLWKK